MFTHVFSILQRWTKGNNIWTSFELQSAKLPVLGRSLTLFDLVGLEDQKSEVTSPSLLETAPKGLAETVGLSWFHGHQMLYNSTGTYWLGMTLYPSRRRFVIQLGKTCRQWAKPRESIWTLWFLAGLQGGTIVNRMETAWPISEKQNLRFSSYKKLWGSTAECLSQQSTQSDNDEIISIYR